MSPYQTRISNRRRARSSSKRIILWIVVVLVLAGGVFSVLELTNTTHLFHHQKPIAMQSGSSETKGEPTTTSNNNSSTGSSSQAGGDNKSDSGTGTPTQTLLTPTGDFVSNHHPNLSGQPAPNQLQSVCNTTPGASCTITFTKDGVTKSLTAQTTDRGGSAYWNWKLQDIGLTAGSWHVQAKATLGSQTKTADDAMALEVAE